MVGSPLHLLQGRDLLVGQNDVIGLHDRKGADDGTDTPYVFPCIQPRTSRNDECQYHTGYGAMNARLQEQIPDDHPEKQEKDLLRHTQLSHIV